MSGRLITSPTTGAPMVTSPKRCGAAYSFLPFADQVAALNYLIDSNDPAKVKKNEDGDGKGEGNGNEENKSLNKKLVSLMPMPIPC